MFSNIFYKILIETINYNISARLLSDQSDLFANISLRVPGALYPDGTSSKLKKDDCVPPGGSYTYRWEVKPEFGPTDDDANCLTWVYHSHIDAPRDISSGLIGALLTCKKGTNIFGKYI